MPSILKKFIARRIKKDIESLERYEKQLERAIIEHRLLAQVKRVQLARWE